MDPSRDAYIENHCCTTSGIHKDCPKRRFVGGTSIHVCECDTPAVRAARAAVGGYLAPHPLPVIDDTVRPEKE